MQAVLDVAEGITDEDYDLFYEVWQEFDPKGTQYMSFENLSEFLDCLEQPLSVPKPNKYKIIKMDIPIITFTNPNTGEVKEDCIFCADVLDILTQDFFSRRSDNPVVEENPQHVEEVKVSFCFVTLTQKIEARRADKQCVPIMIEYETNFNLPMFFSPRWCSKYFILTWYVLEQCKISLK